MGSVAGICLRCEPLVLEAIAAERMPHRLQISGVPHAPFFEVRNYGTDCPGLHTLLVESGHALRMDDGKFLFPFESLASREQAWRQVNADPAWIALRKNTVVSEIAIYRTL